MHSNFWKGLIWLIINYSNQFGLNYIVTINHYQKKENQMSNLTYIVLQSIVLIVYGSYVFNKYKKRKALKALIKPIQIVSHK